MEWGSPFTLGFNIYNMIFSLIIISASIYFIYKNYNQISQMIQKKILESLIRISNHDIRKPLYDVFYGFRHNSVESWLQWIKGQTTKKQEKAFNRLVEYFKEPPKELGLISKEVVKAVILFENEEAFEVLKLLAINTRKKWGFYKSLNSFYEDALVGLMRLRAKEAKSFLLNEIKLAHAINEEESLKKSIVNAFLTIENNNELSQYLKEIIIDKKNNVNIKNYCLSKLIERDFEQAFLLIIEVLKSIINTNHYDQKLFQFSFEFFFKNLYEFECNEYKDLLLKILCNSELELWAIEIFCEYIEKPSFEFDSMLLLEILNTEGNNLAKNLDKSLIKRFMLSNEEQNLIKENDFIQNLELDNQLANTVFSFEEYNDTTIIPTAFRDNFNKINDIFEQKFLTPGIQILLGPSDFEKYYLLKNISSKFKKKSLLVINTEMLINSPSKIDELELMINDSKPCILFMTDIIMLLNNYLNHKKPRSIKIMNILKKFFNDSRVDIFASLTIDKVDLKDDFDELYQFIKSAPNNLVANIIDINTFSARQKKKIFNHYELKVTEKIDSVNIHFDDFMDEIEDLININYLKFLLKYFRNSLLSHGRLIAADLYLKSLNKIEIDKEKIIA